MAKREWVVFRVGQIQKVITVDDPRSFVLTLNDIKKTPSIYVHLLKDTDNFKIK